MGANGISVKHITTSSRLIESTKSNESIIGGVGTIQRQYSCEFLEKTARESSIIPQCVQAYKRNIAGFGIIPEFIDDSPENRSPEAEQEFEKLKQILDFLSIDKPLNAVFEKLVHDVEIYGCGFIECIQDFEGNVVEIKDVEASTIHLLNREEKQTEYTTNFKGVEITRKKQFRKFVQKVGSSQVYFKEFGDPRPMHFETGEYAAELDIAFHANSLIMVSQGYGAYGTVKWEGPLLNVSGARLAERLNYSYFKRGRHTPMMILVKGGSLSDESFDKLQEYINGIEGEAGQHGFLVLEAEPTETTTGMEEKSTVEVEIKSLADMLQKDELFQGYLDNHRKKVQSAFNLPDIFVGYSQDFNVATAREAVRKTEEQVFQPERESYEWVLNNQLLSGYGFKFVKATLLGPDLENSDSQTKFLAIAKESFSPNQLMKEYYDSINVPFENIDEEWAKLPRYVFENQSATISELDDNMDNLIQKASTSGEKIEFISILKDIKKAISSLKDDYTNYP